jgi:hypothetical protein
MLVSLVDFWTGRVGLFIGELLQLEGERGELVLPEQAWRTHGSTMGLCIYYIVYVCLQIRICLPSYHCVFFFFFLVVQWYMASSN